MRHVVDVGQCARYEDRVPVGWPYCGQCWALEVGEDRVDLLAFELLFVILGTLGLQFACLGELNLLRLFDSLEFLLALSALLLLKLGLGWLLFLLH